MASSLNIVFYIFIFTSTQQRHRSFNESYNVRLILLSERGLGDRIIRATCSARDDHADTECGKNDIGKLKTTFDEKKKK